MFALTEVCTNQDTYVLSKLFCNFVLSSNFAIKESISESEASSQQPKKVYNSEDACPHCLEAGITSTLVFVSLYLIRLLSSVFRLDHR